MAKNSVVKFIQGIAYKVLPGGKEKAINTLREAMEAEARCGCGIDCCQGALVLIDQVTGAKMKLTINSGVAVVTPYAEPVE